MYYAISVQQNYIIIAQLLLIVIITMIADTPAFDLLLQYTIT